MKIPKQPAPVADEATQAQAEEPFLKRWSRRKTEVARGVETPPSTNAPAAPMAADPPAVAPALTDEDMPPLDSLDENSEYGDFLSPKVSDKLRRLALRKLFHGAGFNIRDGLDDYDEDMTSFEPLGDIITADLRHRMELERAREAQEGHEAPSARGSSEGADGDAGGDDEGVRVGDQTPVDETAGEPGAAAAGEPEDTDGEV